MQTTTKPPTTNKKNKSKIIDRKAIAIANLKKINEINKFAGEVRGRKRIAKTLEIYIKQYLNTDVSVRHFRKWADAKPGEALPWAWKVVYGDGSGQVAIGKGQVNVLIQILTGQAPAPNVPRGTIDAPPQVDNLLAHNAQSLGISNVINELESEKSLHNGILSDVDRKPENP